MTTGEKGQLIRVRQTPIELGQFLKLALVVGSGGEAKALIQSGLVKVNGALEFRRGKSLEKGDVVEVEDCGVFVVDVPATSR